MSTTKADLLKNKDIKKLLNEFATLYLREAEAYGCGAPNMKFAIACQVDDLLNEYKGHKIDYVILQITDVIAYKGEKLMEFYMNKFNTQVLATA